MSDPDEARETAAEAAADHITLTVPAKRIPPWAGLLLAGLVPAGGSTAYTMRAQADHETARTADVAVMHEQLATLKEALGRLDGVQVSLARLQATQEAQEARLTYVGNRLDHAQNVADVRGTEPVRRGRTAAVRAPAPVAREEALSAEAP